MPELLALIIESNPLPWAASAQSRTGSPTEDFTNYLDNIAAFIGMFLGLHGRNRLVVISYFGPNDSKIVVDSARLEPISAHEIELLTKKGMSEYIAATVSRVIESIRETFENPDCSEDAIKMWKEGFNLAGAIGRALCYINRHCLDIPIHLKHSRTNHPHHHHRPVHEKLIPVDNTPLDGRILLIKSSKENQQQYISSMSTIFAAQKLGVAIDVCNISMSESVLLQQAADLTNGAYLRLEPSSHLLPYLSWTFLSPVELRVGKMKMPKMAIVSSQLPDNKNSCVVDYRPSCFCHRRLIDIGFVCSTCMSVFCAFTPVCRTCLTTFKFNAVR